MTSKTLTWTAVLALVAGLGMGCGGMEEEEEGLTSTENALKLVATCPSGYFKVTPPCVSSSSVCYKCCKLIKLGWYSCTTAPGCNGSFSTFGCPTDGPPPPPPARTTVSCVPYFNGRYWVWHCCYSDGTCSNTPF
jgi:hypothetical protein